MKHRHDLPLSLLAAIEEDSIEGRTRLQKLLFLIQKRIEQKKNAQLSQSYDFIAYDYGPFAKEIYDDIDTLVRRGLVDEDPKELDDGVIKYDYKLTKKGKQLVESRRLVDDSPQEVDAVVSEFADKELSDIIDYVYSQYPNYAENSVIR